MEEDQVLYFVVGWTPDELATFHDEMTTFTYTSKDDAFDAIAIRTVPTEVVKIRKSTHEIISFIQFIRELYTND